MGTGTFSSSFPSFPSSSFFVLDIVALQTNITLGVDASYALKCLFISRTCIVPDLFFFFRLSSCRVEVSRTQRLRASLLRTHSCTEGYVFFVFFLKPGVDRVSVCMIFSACCFVITAFAKRIQVTVSATEEGQNHFPCLASCPAWVGSRKRRSRCGSIATGYS